jgi:hypothetical protein
MFAQVSAPGPAPTDLKLSFAPSSSVSCSQSQPQTLVVPRETLGQARLKARMVNLLRESLYDDAKGVVNIAREKEIRKLAGKLKSGRPE